jgi:hypothetical protein
MPKNNSQPPIENQNNSGTVVPRVIARRHLERNRSEAEMESKDADEAIPNPQLGDTCTPWHLRSRQGKCA